MILYSGTKEISFSLYEEKLKGTESSKLGSWYYKINF